MLPEWILRAGLALVLIGVGWAGYQLLNRLILKNAGQKSRQLPGLHSGTAAIVYFTTPDCAACKAVQRPALARLQQMIGDRLQVIEVNAYEKPELAKAWGVLSVPTTFILDAKGAPRQVNHGVMRAEKLFEQLAAVQ
jgi:thiol-disulfide isomerase/thioredoxin